MSFFFCNNNWSSVYICGSLLIIAVATSIIHLWIWGLSVWVSITISSCCLFSLSNTALSNVRICKVVLRSPQFHGQCWSDTAHGLPFMVKRTVRWACPNNAAKVIVWTDVNELKLRGVYFHSNSLIRSKSLACINNRSSLVRQWHEINEIYAHATFP